MLSWLRPGTWPRLLSSIVLALSCLTGLARAEIPEALADQRIVAIRIAGDTISGTPADATGIRMGVRLSRELLRGAVRKLLAQGRWVNVQVDAEPAADGVVLTFHLEPRIVLRRVEIRGSYHLDAHVARDALGLGAGSTMSPDEVDARAAAVRRAYAERGYLGARVDVRFRDTDDAAEKVLMVELEEGLPTSISAIEFSGERPPAEYAVVESMGIAVGDVLDRRELTERSERAERALRARGYLEAKLSAPVIEIRANRARVSFPAKIGPRYALEVTGAEPLAARDVIDDLALDDQALSNATFDALPARVKDFYARHGFLEAKVSVERKTLRPGRAALTIRIQPGTQIEVLDVGFVGASHFSARFLRVQLISYLEEKLPGGDAVETVDSEVVDSAFVESRPKPRSVVRPWVEAPGTTYYAPIYQEAIKHIVELYQAEGFLSVQVGPIEFERLGKRHATVNIPIREGPRTLLHSVQLNGTKQLSSRELLVASGMMRGAPFSYLGLEEARLRMQSLYQERGHMFARIEPSVRFSSDRTRSEVVFQVVEGYPVRVGEVVVQGAVRTSPSFIKRQLQLGRGALFRPGKARESEAELQSLGVFTGVSVALEDPELPARTKRLIVTVSERPNQFVDFSAGLSTGQGLRAGFEYGYRNLFGSAVGATLRVEFAYQLLFVRDEVRERFDRLLFEDRLERNVMLGLIIPRLPGLGSTRTTLDLVHLRDNEIDFGSDKNGITLAFTENPLPYVTLVQAVDLENNNVDLFTGNSLEEYLKNNDVPDRLRRLLRVPEGNTTIAVLRASISYDRRDSPFIPTTGYFLSMSGEFASTLRTEPLDVRAPGDDFLSRFVKVQFSGSGYVPLGRSVVLAGQVRFGRIMHLLPASRTYPNRAFFLGGVDTMRGYFQDELVPQDIADVILRGQSNLSVNSIVRDGDSFVLLRGELRFPIYGELGGGLFTDIGNLWADAANTDPFDLRPTAGAGLRLNTPVGPLAVDYGIVLKRRSRLQEPFGTLQFSIGLF
jgi:outer membrane protein insertion porin family